MSNEFEKSIKKENIMTILLIVLLLLCLFVIIFVLANKEKTPVHEAPIIIDENTYLKLEDINNDDYLELYKEVNLKRVSFNNIPEILVSDFYNKQNEFLDTINNNIVNNKEYINNYNSVNNINNYTMNSEIDSIIIYDLKDNILSLMYLIEEKIDYIGMNNYIKNIFIDVSNNSLVNNDTILEKYNLNKSDICNDVFDNVLLHHNDSFLNIVEGQELTKVDVENDSENYINRLEENFDSYIYLYFNDGNLYFKYNKNDISNFLFNENLEKVKYSTLKIDI